MLPKFQLSYKIYYDPVYVLLSNFYSAHDLTVHVYYEDIYNVLVFLIATYAAGKVTETLGTPALVGEIIAGFLVGTKHLLLLSFDKLLHF